MPRKQSFGGSEIVAEPLTRQKCPTCKDAVYSVASEDGSGDKLFDMREAYFWQKDLNFLFKGFRPHVCDGRKRA